MKNLINTCNFNKMNKNDKNRIVVNNLMNYLNRSCKIVVRHLNRLSTFIHKSAERWHLLGITEKLVLRGLTCMSTTTLAMWPMLAATTTITLTMVGLSTPTSTTTPTTTTTIMWGGWFPPKPILDNRSIFTIIDQTFSRVFSIADDSDSSNNTSVNLCSFLTSNYRMNKKHCEI